MSSSIPLIILRPNDSIGHKVRSVESNRAVSYEFGTLSEVSKSPETLFGPFHPAKVIKSLQKGLTFSVISYDTRHASGTTEPFVHPCTLNLYS